MGYNLPLDVELSTQRSISAICSGHTASVIRHLNGGIVSHRSSECPGSPMFFEVLLRKSNGDLICCASPRRQCQIMSDLFLDAHRDFGGSWGRMIINTTLNWFPNGRSARSQVAHMQVCAFLRLTIGRVVGRLFVQEVEWYSEYTTLENPGKWIAMEAGDVVKW